MSEPTRPEPVAVDDLEQPTVPAGERLARRGPRALSARRDDALVDLLTAEAAGTSGVASAVEVEGVPVHAKLVPLTDLEPARPRSTADHPRLLGGGARPALADP